MARKTMTNKIDNKDTDKKTNNKINDNNKKLEVISKEIDNIKKELQEITIDGENTESQLNRFRELFNDNLDFFKSRYDELNNISIKEINSKTELEIKIMGFKNFLSDFEIFMTMSRETCLSFIDKTYFLDFKIEFQKDKIKDLKDEIKILEYKKNRVSGFNDKQN